MKANELQIINFLQKPRVRIVIPVYQRNYDWTTTECEELLKDIISVREENRSSQLKIYKTFIPVSLNVFILKTFLYLRTFKIVSIVQISYIRQWIFIKFIGTHAEYDKVDANTVEQF
ncbi:type II toxin-antitoxin system HigB family toxin [Aquiflexum sp.]|uniref:type II toxin-antitoxin system HigB family toxin n=1 Tax=Aquiflexum sp. TaxID=1872584 RepID=UPI0035948326